MSFLNTRFYLNTNNFFEHEIRRRPTDRREVISRIKRIFFICTRIFFILHTDLTDLTDFCLRHFEHEIFLNTRFAEGPLTVGK